VSRAGRLWVAAVAAIAASPAGAGPLGFAPADRGAYGESYTFIADLDGGGYVQLSLGLTNVGPGGLKGICRAVVAEAGGPPAVASERVGADAWRADAARVEVGPCRARVDGAATVVEASLPGLSVRLRFEGAAAPGAAPGGSAVVGGERYQTEVLAFRAPVAARVERSGGAGRELRGAGFADHTRSTVAPRELADRWVRFRALRSERPLLVLVREGRDGSLGPALACEAGGCRAVTRLAVERAPGDPDDARALLRLELDGGAPPLQLRPGVLLYRDAPVEALGLLRVVARLFFGSPVTWVSRGSAAGGTADGPIEGILELELRDG
jgi:hypothetical protein